MADLFLRRWIRTLKSHSHTINKIRREKGTQAKNDESATARRDLRMAHA